MNRRARDIVAVLSTVGLLVIAGDFMSPFKTLALGISFFVFYVLLSIKWYNHSERWFWPLVIVLVALHGLAIVFLNLHLPAGPALTYVAPTMFLDGFAMLGIVTWFERKISRGRDPYEGPVM